jgi:hypothetical protein
MRVRRGLMASGLLSVLFLMGYSAADPATAAGPHEHPEQAAHVHAQAEDDAREHMAEDLVGTPIRVIEKQTADNAARIQRETGLRPGTTRSKAAVAADPGISGSWSPVIGTPIVPIFQAILPNGKVLIWDSVGDNAAETYPVHDFTRAAVWNPVDNTSKDVQLQGSNIFCSGFAHLANGNILVAGGNADMQLDGTVQTHIFDWQTETWSRGKDMAAARWYPAVAEMANGEEVIVGGGPATAEVYQANGALRPLPNFAKYNARLYPFMGSRPDTQLGFLGPYATAYTVTTYGDGAITGTVVRDAVSRDYGSFSTYDIGKSLVVGGGTVNEDGKTKVPTRTAVVVNANSGSVPAVTPTGSLSIGRRQMNATLLADGSVLATGGMSSSAVNTLVDLTNAVTSAERWNPATGQWTVLSSANRVRQYHSTAALLPDGRVMNVEYFTPPYLYKHDGSGQPATRPVISTAPATVGINTTFTLTSAEAATIGKVALVGLGDVTHSVDQGQRYVPLRFTVSGTTLTVTGPPTGGVAPPGYYMLFVVDSAGVPSVARTVQVAKGPNPLMSPVRNSNARCLDVPGSSLAVRAVIQAYACNATKAQAFTRLPSDNSLRVLGNCADVPGQNFVAGQKIQTYTCNNTPAQTWQFGADATIRPLTKTTLCLAPAANNASIVLATCNATAPQKWTW